MPQTKPAQIETFTLPEVAELLDIPVTRVRRLLEDRHLGALRIDGVLRVPKLFIRDGHPLPELHGTFLLLHDMHFSDDEMMTWMFEPEESLGVAPIAALVAGRKAEVRRVAQALL